MGLYFSAHAGRGLFGPGQDLPLLCVDQFSACYQERAITPDVSNILPASSKHQPGHGITCHTIERTVEVNQNQVRLFPGLYGTKLISV